MIEIIKDIRDDIRMLIAEWLWLMGTRVVPEDRKDGEDYLRTCCAYFHRQAPGWDK